MEKQVAEITQRISNMEGNRLEDANTLLATGDVNLTDRLDNLEKMVGQCNNYLTTEDVFDSFKTAPLTEKIAEIQNDLKRRNILKNT